MDWTLKKQLIKFRLNLQPNGWGQTQPEEIKMNITSDMKLNKKSETCHAGIIPFNFQPYGAEQQFVINMPDDSMSGTIEAGEQCLVKKARG